MKTLAVVDHNIATTADRADRASRTRRAASRSRPWPRNAKEFGIEYYDERDIRQGIVHVIGPEQGFTLPGTTIVCGDSHTSTHGAFGALAHGIGTSEVGARAGDPDADAEKGQEHACDRRRRAAAGVTAKDIILAIIGEIGTAGGTGHVIEYGGDAISALSMEGRMTVCNMSIEGGARAGMVAPDEKTLRLPRRAGQRRPMAPGWDAAISYWRDACNRTQSAHFDRESEARRRPPAANRDVGDLPGGSGNDRRRGARPGQRLPMSPSVQK